jgi:hypothetical protein
MTTREYICVECGGRATVRARVLACLRTRPVKRLTIRKRKSEVRTQKSERRAAA